MLAIMLWVCWFIKKKTLSLFKDKRSKTVGKFRCDMTMLIDADHEEKMAEARVRHGP